jgi:phenylalanyl-tRNA synthetase beta chain
MPAAKVTMGGMNRKQQKELKLKRALCGVGAYECIHYSFFSPSDLDLLRLPEDAKERRCIQLINPINEDLSLMRTTLAASMLNAIARNNKRGNLEGRLFEIGKVFIPDALPLTEYPEENDHLCVGVFGAKESFYTLKGIAETVADNLFVQFEYTPGNRTYLHPYQTAVITCEGVEVGYLGKVSYEVADDLDLREDAYIMELDLKVLASWSDRRASFEPLSKFPEEVRDLALVMSKEVTCGQVEKSMRQACPYIKSIRLFDVYEGGQIPADKKSMAFKVTFRPKDQAFEADSVDRFVNKILKTLKFMLDIDLRS